LLKREKLLLNY